MVIFKRSFITNTLLKNIVKKTWSFVVILKVAKFLCFLLSQVFYIDHSQFKNYEMEKKLKPEQLGIKLCQFLFKNHEPCEKNLKHLLIGK